MCGIAGYAGKDNGVRIVVDSLKKLSYRGYDSAGISVFMNGDIKTKKCAGRIENLEELLACGEELYGNACIGHTRWATHGCVSDQNSHPHGSDAVSIVHNGIIENYATLKEELLSEGYTFKSETDTEVGALLLDKVYRELGDPKAALFAVSKMLHGSFAIAATFRDFPDKIFAVRKESPLMVGVSEDGVFIASDIPAFLQHTRQYFRLGEGEIVVVSPEGYKAYDKDGNEIEKEIKTAPFDIESAKKEGYDHFMRKEISDEPGIVSRLISIYTDEFGMPKFDISDDIVKNTSHITIVGCGTAYHAGLYFKYILEKISNVRADVYIASEFRYSLPRFSEGELVVVISQSGETADTISSLKAVKEKGIKTLGIVNVVGSTIATLTDEVVYTYAGLEISVASTKAYTAQCTVSALLALNLARRDEENLPVVNALCEEVKKLPDVIGQIIESEDSINHVANEIHTAENLFFIGRRADYIAALEGSLKLKEISYIHSECYPAGELKHGTISLVTDKTPVVSLFGDTELIPKMVSNLKEVSSRGAITVGIAARESGISGCDYLIELPAIDTALFPITCATSLQLFAYHVARARGCDIDMPRNLAKSVTVE